MLNLRECKKILQEDNIGKYDDKEVSEIRDFLYQLARIQIGIENSKNRNLTINNI